MDPNTNTSLYLIPNPDGTPGKTIQRRRHGPPTTVAMDDDFDTITAIHTEVNAGVDRNSFLRGQELVPVSEAGSTSERPPSGYEDSDQYQSYMREMRRAFGGEKVDLELKKRRVRNLPAESIVSEVPVAGSPLPSSAVIPPKEDEQSIPMVQRKVLEDGPEREVTLWRHEVEGKHNYNHDESPKKKTAKSSDRSRRSSEHPRTSDRPRSTTSTSISPTSLASSISLASSTSLASTASTRRIPAPQPHKHWDTYTPTQSDISESSLTASALSTLALHIPAPYGIHLPDNRTSSPAYSALSESTIGGLLSPPPMRIPAPHAPLSSHRTVASSTVSSAASDFSLSTVLDSCTPSLAHVAPLLEGLGIRGEDGLRALASLSAETRDREVKEEALGRGLSIVEWAVLVDLLKKMGYTNPGVAKSV